MFPSMTKGECWKLELLWVVLSLMTICLVFFINVIVCCRWFESECYNFVWYGADVE